MCIIAIKPADTQLWSEDTIRTMFANNPDGAGFMYADKGKVTVKKGFMDVEDLIGALTKTDLTDKTVVLHCRIGTSGNYDELNCHPFPIYGKNATSFKTNLAMAHNGILYSYTPMKGSPINDTQVFIMCVLSGLSKGFLDNPDCIKLIEELIDRNKFAFLDGDGKLTTIGEFIEDDGYIYSNTSYKPRKPKKAFKFTNTYEPKEEQISIWDDTDETGFWKDWDSRHTF